MARTFAGTPDRFQGTTAVLTAPPFTMACWFNETTTASQHLMSIDDGTTTNRFLLRTDGTSHILATTNAANASTSTTYTASTWNHACGVWASATDRRAFLNGGGKGTNATSATVTAPIDTWIGCSGSGVFWVGAIAECAIWNIALADADIAILGNASTPISPLFVHPESLVFYCPLLGAIPGAGSVETEAIGSLKMTDLGATTITAHPSMYYPANHNRLRFRPVTSIAVTVPVHQFTSSRVIRNIGY